MSREIKFRAWDTTENKMLDSERVQFFDLLTINGEGSIWRFMQYTGLKDKNGVEIYEGDIVLKQGGKRGKIVYYAGGFFWENKDTTMTPLSEFGFGLGMQYEVIGNIYETLELIG